MPAVTSFLISLSQWDKQEIEEKLNRRVEFSKRAIGKLLQVSFDMKTIFFLAIDLFRINMVLMLLFSCCYRLMIVYYNETTNC